MATTPTTEPTSITAGDSLTWQRSLADYAADVWTLKYRLINSTAKLDLTATASGTNHLITISTAVSAAIAPGLYAWSAWVEKTGERVTIGSGTLRVLPNLAVQAVYDARSDAAVIVDQLMAAYKSYSASNGHVAEYEIAGRRMKYRSGAEILAAINHWKAVLASEQRAARIAAGLGAGNKLLVRF